MNAVSRARIVAAVCLAMLPADVFAGETTQRIVVSDVGFATPESVEYYAAEDVYLVSNINGSPAAADNNGFISKIKPDGSVVALKWIEGGKNGVTLNAPKGSAVVGEKLFVADLDHVRVFELPSGRQLKSLAIEGSTFLNGVTPGPYGSIYISDSGLAGGMAPSGTDAIYQVSWELGKYHAIIKDKELGHPNGLWDDYGQLLVNTLGSGKLFSLDAHGKRTERPAPPKGALDGLAKLDDGRVIVSSWEGSAVYALDKEGKFTVLADGLESPADFGVDTERKRLLIPLFKQDKVVVLPY